MNTLLVRDLKLCLKSDPVGFRTFLNEKKESSPVCVVKGWASASLPGVLCAGMEGAFSR